MKISAADTGLWKTNYEYGELQTGGTVDALKNNGNVAKQTITVPTIAATTGFTAIQTYSYDELDRLKSATETVGGVEKWKQTFDYDRFGNKRLNIGATTLQSSESSAIPKVANPEVLPSNNQYKADQDSDGINDYLYDTSGNITKNAKDQNFTFDAENRQLTALGSNLSMSYAYDGNDKRVKSHNAVTNQTTFFVYDADGKLAAEYTINIPLPTNPTISYLTEDALGSVRVVTDSAGDIKARRDFLPFGEEIFAGIGSRNTNQKYSSDKDDTSKKFATYQRDAETGLDYAQSRYYSPMQGRFTSPDEFKGGPDELFDFEDDASSNPTFYADLTNPQSLNKYQYTYNNPYKFIDPTGHNPCCEEKTKDGGQLVISIIGLIPGAGEIADVVNAGISVIRGNYGEAALDIASAVTGPIGNVFAIGNRVRKVAKVVSKADDVNDTRRVTKSTKNVTPEKAKNLKEAEKKNIPKNQLGPSGKPKVVVVKKSTKKRAKDAARNEGQGKPALDNNPKKGKSHYHPTKRDGTRKKGKDNVHYEFPLKRGKLPN